MTMYILKPYQLALLERAFCHLNDRLFENRLPEPLIFISRRKPATDKPYIKITPNDLKGGYRTTLPAMIQQMVDLEQRTFGTPSPQPLYRNKEWQNLMLRVGMVPEKPKPYVDPEGAARDAIEELIDIVTKRGQ